MSSAQIDIYWDPVTGEMYLEINGVGSDCLDVTRALEQLLGIESGDRGLTHEYYEGDDGKKVRRSVSQG
jgi:hypothetical protein